MFNASEFHFSDIDILISSGMYLPDVLVYLFILKLSMTFGFRAISYFQGIFRFLKTKFEAFCSLRDELKTLSLIVSYFMVSLC